MPKLARWILAAALMACCAPLPATAQSRVALVLGNSAYARGPIRTSLPDAGLVAEALNGIGFEIMEAADLDQGDLRRAFSDFIARMQAAGPDAIAFVYFSGYALEFEGENYLVPVDARLTREDDIPLEAVRVSDVLYPLASSTSGAKVVVLDAARPLPLTLPVAPGLSPMEPPPMTLVAYSSAPGTFAEDNSQAYGAYAGAIAEMVREPGLDLDTVFSRIRLRTHELTQGQQTPWHATTLPADAVLVPDDGSLGAPAMGAAPGIADKSPVRRQPRPMREISPDEAYGVAIEMDSLPGYTEYVETYPDSLYAPRVGVIIRARRETLGWVRALRLDTREAYWTYLARYPRGIYAADAQRRLRRLAAVTLPPPGFAPLGVIDVPPPLAREPREFVHLYPPLPRLPQNLIGPRPAYLVSLPPPPPPRGPRLLPAPFGLPVVPRLGEPPRRVGVVTPGAPGAVTPGAVAPGMVRPGSVAPGSATPGTVAPGTIRPGAVAPGMVSPGPPGARPTDMQRRYGTAPGTVQPNAGAPPEAVPPTSGAPVIRRYGTGTSAVPPNTAPVPQGVPRQSVAPLPPPAPPPPQAAPPPPQPQIRQSVAPPAGPPPAVMRPVPPAVARPVPPAVQQAPAVTQPPRGATKGPPPGRRCPIVNGVERCG